MTRAGVPADVASSTQTRTLDEPSRDAEAMPSRIGRYEVIERIGRGGMGVVFAALDPELERTVAIKLVRPRSDRENAQQRLHKEAQALARLAHPNVVAIHDLVIEPGRIGVVMQLVEGTSMDRWLATPRARNEILACFRDAGRGLAAAHAAGVIHRDVKPANILVDDKGVARVTDFGIALVVESLDDGTVVGTPPYMAPEQFAAKDITPATDQFGFCVSLWEALAGTRPFRGKTHDEVSAEVAAQAIQAPPRGKIPGWLERVLRRGMAVRAADRFRDMDTLVAALAPPRRALWIAGAGTIGLAAVVTLLAVQRDDTTCRDEGAAIDNVWTSTRQELLAATLSAVPTERAGDISRRAREIIDKRASAWRDEAIATCGAQDTAEVIAARRACLSRAAADLDAAIEELAAIHTPTALVHALAIARSGRDPATCRDPSIPTAPAGIAPPALRDRVAALQAAWNAGRVAYVLDEGERMSTEVDASKDPSLQQDFWRVQAAAAGRGQTKRMRDATRRSAEAATIAGDDLGAVLAWTKAVDAAAESHDLDVVDDLLAMARASASRARSPMAAQAIAISEANVAIAKRDWDTGAETCIPIAKDTNQGFGEIQQRAFGCATAALDHAHRWKDLEALVLAIDPVLAQNFGREHPLYVTNIVQRASTRFELGDQPGARALWREALAGLVTAYGPDSVAEMMLLRNMANFESRFGKGDVTAEEIDATTRALAIARKRLPIEDHRRGIVVWDYANMKVNLNEPDEGVAAYEEAMHAFTADDDPEMWARLAVTAAGIDVDRKKCERVYPLVDRMVALYGEGKITPAVAGSARSLRGQCWVHDGKLDQGLAEMTQAVAVLEKADDPGMTANAEIYAAELAKAHGRAALARRLALSARARFHGDTRLDRDMAARIDAILR